MSKTRRCTLSQEALNWINGELLGDGCLQSHSSYSAKFTYTSRHLEYIEYVSDTLNRFGIKRGGKIYRYQHKLTNNIKYTYSSLCYQELLLLKEVWYPDGKKLVPRGLMLTPLVCRQWYIGDGCITHRFKKRPDIILATQGFNVYDVDWLCMQFSEIGILATRRPAQNTICISTCSVKDFLKYIGDCPVECYKYKWVFNDSRCLTC